MNNLRNSVRLIGRLGMDPEVKELSQGKKLAKFSLATTDSYKDQAGERVSETQWHNIVVWGSTADFVQKYLRKGMEVAVEGKLTNRSYTDKDEVKKYVTEIVLKDVLIIQDPKPAIAE